MRRMWRWLAGLSLAGIVLVLLYAGRGSVLPSVARWLDVGEPPRRADYMLILNGGENVRPFVGAVLLKLGFARRALITEVRPSPAVEDQIAPPPQEVNHRVLVHCGVPPESIEFLPEDAVSTYDEAKALAAFLQAMPDARVLVVTSDCHTRRSRWVFNRVLGNRARQISFVSCPNDEFSLDQWWRNQRGFLAIVGEWLKLVLYVARYGYGGYWVLACIVLGVVIALVRHGDPPRASCP